MSARQLWLRSVWLASPKTIKNELTAAAVLIPKIFIFFSFIQHPVSFDIFCILQGHDDCVSFHTLFSPARCFGRHRVVHPTFDGRLQGVLRGVQSRSVAKIVECSLRLRRRRYPRSRFRVAFHFAKTLESQAKRRGHVKMFCALFWQRMRRVFGHQRFVRRPFLDQKGRQRSSGCFCQISKSRRAVASSALRGVYRLETGFGSELQLRPCWRFFPVFQEFGWDGHRHVLVASSFGFANRRGGADANHHDANRWRHCGGSKSASTRSRKAAQQLYQRTMIWNSSLIFCLYFVSLIKDAI